jgi:hypothetical protein
MDNLATLGHPGPLGALGQQGRLGPREAAKTQPMETREMEIKRKIMGMKEQIKREKELLMRRT